MQFIRRIGVAALCSVGVVFPAGGSANGSPVLELTGGLSGGGFNARVVGTGSESAYFNPGLLPLSPETFDVSVFVLGDDTNIDVRDRPLEADISPSVYDAWLGDGNGGISPLESSPLATSDISERQSGARSSGSETYLGVGMSKRLVEDKLVIGFLLVVPLSNVQGQDIFYNDEREQYFSNSLRMELYSDRLRLMTFAFAVGGRLSELLSVGIGFTAGISTNASSPTFVPDGSDLGTVVIDADVRSNFALVPHFGLVAEPSDRVRVTATLRSPNKVEVVGRNEVRVANGVTDVQEFSFVSGYEPLTLSLGSSVEIWRRPGERKSFGLVATGMYRTWSRYLDRHGESPRDPWNNTLSVSAGARFHSAESTGYVDAAFVPSPVPKQAGRENYVDNDRVSMTAGLRSLTSVLGVEIKGGFQLQAHRLIGRSVVKSADAPEPVVDEFPDNAVNPAVDPSAFLPEAAGLQSNNPGFPGYSSGGWILGAGVTVSADF